MSQTSGALFLTPLSGAERGIGRGWFFFALFLLSASNGLAGHVLRSIQDQGWQAIPNLFGVSAIVWVALAAGLKILHEAGSSDPLRREDLWLGSVIAVAALLPFATASMGGLTLLSLYAIVTSAPGSTVRRSGIIFLAMTGVLIWGRLALAIFSRPLLDLDALFVSTLIGAERDGNTLWYEGAPMRLVVAPGCSSIQGISAAILFWATVNQFFNVPFGWKPVLWCAAAVGATIAINVVRIGSMLQFPEHQEAIHVGWGWHVAMWITLATVSAICLYGARRHVFDPR